MKRMLFLLCAAVFFVSLAGCGGAPSGAGSAAGSPADAGGPVITTEEQVRALYAEESRPIQAVTPFEGDFLVEHSGGNQLDWVYGRSGVRRSLLWLPQGIAAVEILAAAEVQVLTDGVSIFNGYRGFPHRVDASLASLYGADGQALAYDADVWPDGPQTEPYWAPVAEAHSFGMFGRREAVASAQVEVSGLALSFAPLADGSDFTAAYCAPPGTEISFDPGSGTMTVTCRDTFLDSGELDRDAADAGYTEAWLRENHSLYPEDFPAGSLSGSCPLIESASIAQSGNDAVVTLVLQDGGMQYTVEEGFVGPYDDGPYFRLKLRAAGAAE